MVFNNLYVIGKKNSQTSVSDADREIPTLGSTDSAGNETYLVSGIVRLSSGLDFSVCIGTRCQILFVTVQLLNPDRPKLG